MILSLSIHRAGPFLIYTIQWFVYLRTFLLFCFVLPDLFFPRLFLY
jgi:hypothetical protein